MDKLFFVDKNKISYTDLIFYLNDAKTFFDLTEVEIFVLNELKKHVNKKINSVEELISTLRESEKEIILETSGTTGKPKVIKHTISGLTKNVKIKPQYQKDIWGLCYSVGKMAFYQVFLQALFNESTIINLNGYDFDVVENRIIEQKITHISATPTFYRILISSNKVFENIQQITLGGEPSDENLIKHLSQTFPTASLKNIYASTETASLFASSGSTFIIPSNFEKLIKIKEQKLFVHKSLVGKIESDIFENNEWFDTKDIVEIISDREFKIIGRENVELNISGLKINPVHVESVINSLNYVVNSQVFSKKNSVTGNILCVNLMLNTDKTKMEIKKDLKKLLNYHEVPTIINIVKKIEINENIKLSRK